MSIFFPTKDLQVNPSDTTSPSFVSRKPATDIGLIHLERHICQKPVSVLRSLLPPAGSMADTQPHCLPTAITILRVRTLSLRKIQTLVDDPTAGK